jgi:hypothetical protein
MTAAPAQPSPVSTAIDPYRNRFAEDAADFTVALLDLAKANAKGTAGFNEPSPEDAVALHALAGWRRDAQHALRRVRGLPADAPGRALAIQWLKAMIAGLDLQRQGLSLIDPAAAADASRRAGKAIARSHRLEARLDRELP